MKKYKFFVDASGSIEIIAESEDDAREKLKREDIINSFIDNYELTLDEEEELD